MPDNHPCDLVSQCFLLTAPFRGMLLTPQGGPRCLAPTAHQIPVYLMVFSTFLCRAFTAQYLHTPRSPDIRTERFHGAPKLPHTRAEMRVFYPVLRWRELAAGWRYTTELTAEFGYTTLRADHPPLGGYAQTK